MLKKYSLFIAFCLPLFSWLGCSANNSVDAYAVGNIDDTTLGEGVGNNLDIDGHDGIRADKTIIMRGAQVKALNETQKKAVKRASLNHQTIVLLDAKNEHISALLQDVLRLAHRHTLPDGIESAEVYSYTTKPDGGVSQLTSYGLVSGYNLAADKLNDTKLYREQRARGLKTWLQSNTKQQTKPDDCASTVQCYMSSFQDSAQFYISTLENVKFSHLTDGDGKDETDDTVPAPLGSVINQIDNFIYPLHDRKNNLDWFVVDQKVSLPADVAFTKNTKRLKGYYAKSYEINNTLVDLGGDLTLAVLPETSPPSTSGAKTTTSSMSVNFGGGVNLMGPSGSLSANFTNSTTVSIPDVTVTNKSADSVNNAHWTYSMPYAQSSSGNSALDDPKPMSTTTFTPENQWYFYVTAAGRDKSPAGVKLKIDVISTYAITRAEASSGSPFTNTTYKKPWSHQVTIAYAPTSCTVDSDCETSELCLNLVCSLPPPAAKTNGLSAGRLNTCAIDSEGLARCWGDNASKQIDIPSSLGTVTEIASGGTHTCALRSGGTVQCWGSSADGKTTAPSGTMKHISAGENHTCAIKSDDTLTCWGNNAQGQTTVPAGLKVSQVSAGSHHTCVLTTDGAVRCWGDNEFNQIDVPTTLGAVQQVASGAYNTCVLTTDGKVSCWGMTTYNVNTIPAELAVADAAMQITVGEIHACAVKKSDSRIMCWGNNDKGQTTVPASVLGVFSVEAGAQHTCATVASEGVTCWGNNDKGQTGSPSDF